MFVWVCVCPAVPQQVFQHTCPQQHETSGILETTSTNSYRSFLAVHVVTRSKMCPLFWLLVVGFSLNAQSKGKSHLLRKTRWQECARCSYSLPVRAAKALFCRCLTPVCICVEAATYRCRTSWCLMNFGAEDFPPWCRQTVSLRRSLELELVLSNRKLVGGLNQLTQKPWF